MEFLTTVLDKRKPQPAWNNWRTGTIILLVGALTAGLFAVAARAWGW